MGVDSISVIALARALSKELGVSIRPQRILEQPTLAGISDVVETSRNGSAGGTKQAAARISRDDLAWSSTDTVTPAQPCLPIQVGLLSQAIAMEGTRYVHDFDFVTERSVENVEAAFKAAIVELDVLRLTCHYVGGEHPWICVVHSDTAYVASNCLKSSRNRSTGVSQVKKSIAEAEGLLWSAEISRSSDKTLIRLVSHHA